jgi:hypothetical protein
VFERAYGFRDFDRSAAEEKWGDLNQMPGMQKACEFLSASFPVDHEPMLGTRSNATEFLFTYLGLSELERFTHSLPSCSSLLGEWTRDRSVESSRHFERGCASWAGLLSELLQLCSVATLPSLQDGLPAWRPNREYTHKYARGRSQVRRCYSHQSLRFSAEKEVSEEKEETRSTPGR